MFYVSRDMVQDKFAVLDTDDYTVEFITPEELKVARVNGVDFDFSYNISAQRMRRLLDIKANEWLDYSTEKFIRFLMWLNAFEFNITRYKKCFHRVVSRFGDLDTIVIFTWNRYIDSLNVLTVTCYEDNKIQFSRYNVSSRFDLWKYRGLDMFIVVQSFERNSFILSLRFEGIEDDIIKGCSYV